MQTLNDNYPKIARVVKDLPEDPHFAVLVNNVIHYTMNWGRGDESCSERYLDYITFNNEAALEKWILDEGPKKTYKVIKVYPAAVSIKTTVSVTS